MHFLPTRGIPPRGTINKHAYPLVFAYNSDRKGYADSVHFPEL